MGKSFMLFGLYAPKLASSKFNIKCILLLSIDVNFGACQFGGMCLICCGMQAKFYHKFLPDLPLHQSGVF